MNLITRAVAMVAIAIVFALAPAGKGAASGPQTPAPNVLFIAVDDLRTELGCYGETAIKTPHIDRLATTGVLFERAYCQLAVCNPSRVSIMTGLRPDSTKVWDLITRFRETIPDAVTLPQHFMQNGYRAESFGKIFHNPWPDNRSWSQPHQWPENRSLWSEKARQRHSEYRDQMRTNGRPQRAIDRIRPQATEIVDIADEEHTDGAIAEQAIEAMRRLAEQEKPFFLAAGFVRPHLPFVVPRKYWDLYDRDSIPLADNSFLPKESPEFAMNTMYELRDYIDFDQTPSPQSGSLTEEQRRRLKHGYYAAVSFIDSLVGKLLGELESLGMTDNTIVVLWSDHGWKLGEHNSWCKQTNYEIDTRVPLIIRMPGAAGNGSRCDALVELVDLYPTLCQLTDLSIDDSLEGTSLAPLLSDPRFQWNEAAFSQFKRQSGDVPLMGYAMRTENHRFIEWQNRRSGEVVATELYNHQTDPGENLNVAGQSENEALVEQLRRRMWSSLPKPPEFVAAKKPRPRIVFRNRRDQAITLFWIDGDGNEQKQGEIAPGSELSQNSTMGHRFIARGDSFASKVLEVTGLRKTVTFGPARPRPPSDPPKNKTIDRRPNIVFCMADDWSWPHASILGDPVVKTPNFDRVASEGMLIEHAFVSTPSCTPSRLSILTGQHHWRLREGDSLGGSLRKEFPVYTDLLATAGYRVGRFGKGVWPSEHTFRDRDSFGDRFKSFEEFLKDRIPNQPFCYWHGGQDPHRPYDLGIGKKSGIELSKIKVPNCLPDNEVVRSDLADYSWEVQRFDSEVGTILEKLEAIGELENTIIVVSGDNGMPFPRCKATLYDLGTRVPLAVRWGSTLAGGQKRNDFVSLCDLAPTFLEAAGIEPPKEMTGRSLLSILEAKDDSEMDASRSFVLTGVERHVYSYPKRAIRTNDFLYIHNFDASAWPSGEVEGEEPEYDFSVTPWPTTTGAFSHAIDPSPTKQFLRLNRNAPAVKTFADRVFSRAPDEELYDLRKDPGQLTNVAGQSPYRSTLVRLRRKLQAELIKTNDPRLAVSGYKSLEIEGWPVRVGDKLMQEHANATTQALELLADQLKIVKRVLPASAVEQLIDVPIWLSPKYEGFGPTGEYHPSAGWLGKNGRHPKLHRCIEFTNVPIFEREVQRMPVLVLHELAHAYHDQVLGFDHQAVRSTFEIAKSNGSYDAVRRGNGKTEKAYAMSNDREYFAETSEAYFGRNDFYPFDRNELTKHDPRMANLLERLWSNSNREVESN